MPCTVVVDPAGPGSGGARNGIGTNSESSRLQFKQHANKNTNEINFGIFISAEQDRRKVTQRLGGQRGRRRGHRGESHAGRDEGREGGMREGGTEGGTEEGRERGRGG